MRETNPKLLELMAAVENVCPQLADHWHVTAIIESLGYTDISIHEEFGIADALTLGKYLYSQHQAVNSPNYTVSPSRSAAFTLREELLIFVEQFFRSFTYAVPLLVTLFLGNVTQHDSPTVIPVELASLLTLATLASLCTSGGFIQIISRRVGFYKGLGQVALARQISSLFIKLGIVTSVLCGLIGLGFGLYQTLAADDYLIIANVYFLILNLLWLMLAVLSVQWSWSTPVILGGLTVVLISLKLTLGISALEAQIVATGLTLPLVTALTIGFNRQPSPAQASTTVPNLPRLGALAYQLAAYFGYGVTYFSYIFADRLVAGFSVNPAAGLIFAVDSEYQRSMDLALLNFLLLVPCVEYLGYRFIRAWYSQSKSLSVTDSAKFARQLRNRYLRITILTVALFGCIILLTMNWIRPLLWGSIDLKTVWIGCIGYLCFGLGLLNSILLLSLGRITDVLKTLVPALVINLIVAYLLANLIDVSFAAVGLMSSSAWFMTFSCLAFAKVMKQPDYAYSLSGY
jgi:hypothetical protein